MKINSINKIFFNKTVTFVTVLFFKYNNQAISIENIKMFCYNY
ncbi:protein of unknown function [Tepidibacter aestuarii]|nr:protein of unknown function [Tepidibacter aestuarii]